MTENYVLKIDSISGTSWDVGSSNQGNFTTHLFTPLKDIIEVNVITANFDASGSGSNVAYMSIEELESPFSRGTGIQNSTGIISDPPTKGKVNNTIAVFNVSGTGRTIFKEQDYYNGTKYMYPIQKLSRLQVRMFDEDGNNLPTISNVFVTLSVKCKRTNLCL
jgi:hypothetical protein